MAERGQTPTNSMTSRVSLGSSEMPSLGNWILEEEGNGYQERKGGRVGLLEVEKSPKEVIRNAEFGELDPGRGG